LFHAIGRRDPEDCRNVASQLTELLLHIRMRKKGGKHATCRLEGADLHLWPWPVGGRLVHAKATPPMTINKYRKDDGSANTPGCQNFLVTLGQVHSAKLNYSALGQSCRVLINPSPKHGVENFGLLLGQRRCRAPVLIKPLRRST